jgi:hypothetical protein
MIVDTLKAQATAAMKAKDSVAMAILRLALGEIQMAEVRGGKALTDDEAAAVVRKLLKSNEETLAHAQGEQRATLERECVILKGVLPAGLTPEQIAELLAPVADAIKGAGNDGQATGIAMKHLKAAGKTAPGNDVAAAVKKIRA